MTGDRLIPLDGPANFRDLGGYTAGDGSTVRRGRVFRSDSLSYLSDADVAYLTDTIGLHSVIDLRAFHEVEEFTHGPLEVRGLEYHHIPIVDETRGAPKWSPFRKAPAPMTLDEIYVLMLEQFGSRLTSVLRVIAAEGTQPVVFHCAAGKDRTGLVAALLLGVLGVDDESIVRDFTQTADRMPELISRHLARADAEGTTAEVGQAQYGAHATAMELSLAHIDEKYGSVEAYVLAHDLEPKAVTGLRRGLLE